MPSFLGEWERSLVLSIGFAVLSINTPLCILLSCDPDLEQAVRFLPQQKRTFAIPYTVFIFSVHLLTDSIFLCSYELQAGGIGVRDFLMAACFALLSAAGSVFLEWFNPIRSWRIENDLWHHPRKYVIPSVMLLLALGFKASSFL